MSNAPGLNSIYFTDINDGWAVGYYGTILHTTDGGTTFIDSNVELIQPDHFELSQNYPNPFNPFTKIVYHLPKSSLVQFKVYDLLGREIASLVNEQKPAGSYEVNFDASDIPSGVYIYQ